MTESAGSTIQLVVACDEQYAMHAAATIASACVVAGRQRDINVHVLATSLSRSSARRLAHLPEALPGLSVTVHHRDLEAYADFRQAAHISRAAYLRLEMVDTAQIQGGRVLYLDSDTICVRPLDALWTTNLGDAAVGACRDQSVATLGSPHGVGAFEQAGLDGSLPYFNSGVLLVDVQRWVAVDPARVGREYARQFGHLQNAHDQELLNVAFARNWHQLHPRWNTSPRLANALQVRGALPSHIDAIAATEAVGEPAIVHFLGRKKPWHLRSTLPWTTDYLAALEASQWFQSRGEFLRWRATEGMSLLRRTQTGARRNLRQAVNSRRRE